MQEFAIIVAGGSGSRMKSDIPKQFIPVNGLPVLMHTINAFRKYSAGLSIIVVLPEDQFSFWNELCKKYDYREIINVIAGGNSRFQSVKNGLDSIQTDEGIVAVHDGVRPVIGREIIANCFSAAVKYGAAVLSVPLKDSVREVSQDGENNALDRSRFRLIQTPQTFRIDLIRKAFKQSYQESFTDCASVLESAGTKIHLVEGSYENIKITTPEDLEWAKIYLS